MEYYKNLQYDELDGEIFKDVCGYEGYYQVSNYGRVRSLKSHIILKQNLKSTGYLHIALCGKKDRKYVSVHRLVAIAFLDNSNQFKLINHKDECKSNNIVDNLEWCTSQYNNTYGNRIKKMVDKKAIEIVQLDVENNYIKTWKNESEVGRIFNISSGVIIGCCNGMYKTACGYRWMYKQDYINGIEKEKIIYKFKNKPFAQLTLDGKLIREWYSLMQMHKETGYGITEVSKCLNKKRNKTHNYKWIYLNEYYDDLDDENKEYSNELGHDYLMNIAATKKII